MPLFGAEERRMRMPQLADYTPLVVGQVERAGTRASDTISRAYQSAAENEGQRWQTFGRMTAAPLEGLRGLSDAAEWRQRQRVDKRRQDLLERHIEGADITNEMERLRLEEAREEHEYMNERPSAAEEASREAARDPLAPWRHQSAAAELSAAPRFHQDAMNAASSVAPSLALPATATQPRRDNGFTEEANRQLSKMRPGDVAKWKEGATDIEVRKGGQIRRVGAPLITTGGGAAPSDTPATRRRALLQAQYGNLMSEEGMGDWRRGRQRVEAGQHDQTTDAALKQAEANLRLTNAQIGQVGVGAGMTRQDRLESQGIADLTALYMDPTKNAPIIAQTKVALIKGGLQPHHVQGIEARAMAAAAQQRNAAGQANYLLMPGGQDAQGKVLDLKNRLNAVGNASRNAAGFSAHVGYGEYMPTSLHPMAQSALGEFQRALAPIRPDAAQVGDSNIGLHGIFTPSDKMRALVGDEISKAEFEIQQLKALPMAQPGSPGYSQQFATELAGLEAQLYAAKQASGGGQTAPAGAGPAHNTLNLMAPQAGGSKSEQNRSLFAPRSQPGGPPLQTPPGQAPQQGGAPPPTAAPMPRGPAPQQGGAPPQARMQMPSFRHLARTQPVDPRQVAPI